MIPGLHLLFASVLGGQVNPKIMMFLSHINPLSLWLIAVTAIAIAGLADMEKNKVIRVAAVILWVISILPEVVEYLCLPPEHRNYVIKKESWQNLMDHE